MSCSERRGLGICPAVAVVEVVAVVVVAGVVKVVVAAIVVAVVAVALVVMCRLCCGCLWTKVFSPWPALICRQEERAEFYSGLF